MFTPQLIDKRFVATFALTLGLPSLLSAGEPGKMTREIWNGVPGTAITDFTSSPRYLQSADSLTTFAGASVPQDIGDNFASRVRGYITAPVTGDYTFWVASDDGCELRISPTDSKCGRTKIASISGWVPPFQWDNMATQKSAPIRLVAGQKYFIEALYKESYGGDHLAIAWQTPSGSREAIPASALESYTADANDADDDDLPDSWELAHGFRIEAANITPPDQLPFADPDHDGYTNFEESAYGADPYTRGGMPGTLLLESWYSLLGAKVEALTLTNKFAGPAERSELIFAAETPVYRGENYGTRMSGYIIAPTTGNYTFYVAGDASCQLSLSPSTSEFTKTKIAYLDGWANIRDWQVSATQTSAPVALVAGQKYYIEGLMKESYGGDHLEIGWKTPGSSSIAVIPSSALESYVYDVQDPDGDHMPSAWESSHGLNPAVHDAALDPDGDAVPNSLEYPVTLATAGVYQLHLTFTPVTDTAVNRDYEIVFSADGKTIQRQIVTVAEATSGHAKILSPWLTTGSHTLRVFVDNSYHFRRVTIDQLAVLAARGSDANSNGTPDWVDLRLAKYNSFEAPNESITSPVCLEGKSRWFEMSRINGTPVQAAPDDRWYADVPLSSSQPTAVTASLENGALSSTRLITWQPTNLLTTSALSIRLGDSLKLTAFNSITASTAETFTLTVEGQTITRTSDQPLVHAFTTAGNIPIQIAHSHNGILTTASVIITVIAAPVIESPVCVVGSFRELEFPPLPAGVTMLMDSGLVIRDSQVLADGSNRYTLSLPTLSSLPAVTRIGTNGPILGSIPFRMMRLRTTAQTGVFVGGQIDPSTYDIHMPVIVDGINAGINAGIKIDFRIFIGGVTFDDGTLLKSLTMPDDVDATGQALLHFYKTGNYGSNCHRIEIFQGNHKIANY